MLQRFAARQAGPKQHRRLGWRGIRRGRARANLTVTIQHCGVRCYLSSGFFLVGRNGGSGRETLFISVIHLGCDSGCGGLSSGEVVAPRTDNGGEGAVTCACRACLARRSSGETTSYTGSELLNPFIGLTLPSETTRKPSGFFPYSFVISRWVALLM